MSYKIPLAAALLMGLGLASAQGQLGIEACREKARLNNPLARQAALLDEGARLDLAIAKRGYLPRLSLGGKASYQSDAISLSTPMFSVEADKDQYSATAEFSQTVWDGGAIATQIHGLSAASKVEREKLAVDIYALNDRVDQLFFGILAAKEQLRQNEVLVEELETNRRRVEACLRNGVASPTDLDAVRVEVLSARQRSSELVAAEKSYREMLALLIGEPLSADAVFAMPDSSSLPVEAKANKRPELGLFDAQAEQCEAQKEAVRVSTLPRLSAFLQTAYGKPGLNMLKAEAAPYWVGGLRLSWSLNGLLDTRDELARIETRKCSIEAQKDSFVLNSDLQVARLENDLVRLRELVATDEDILALRAGMTRSTEGKLENGAATTDDVLKAIDAESLARRAKSLHEVQLVQTAYALKNALNE